MKIFELRREYHSKLCVNIIRLKADEKGIYPNFADSHNSSSRKIAYRIWEKIKTDFDEGMARYVSEQETGMIFEQTTRWFISEAFHLLSHLRPGRWTYSATAISDFDQYAHLSELQKLSKQNREFASSMGLDYIIKPDIVIGRMPVSDEEINQEGELLGHQEKIVQYSPFRSREGHSKPILHASISCKWTIRSDRSQNVRTEALNLIRNRKGHTPHILAVTAEPLPTRIASLALGTGDLDCVYHIALHELQDAIEDLGNEDQKDMLYTLINGRRLRDISDLPFDLAI